MNKSTIEVNLIKRVRKGKDKGKIIMGPNQVPHRVTAIGDAEQIGNVARLAGVPECQEHKKTKEQQTQ